VTATGATLVDRIRSTNRATVGNWDLFAAHRGRMTSLIAALCGPGVDRLAILGAGNCNDIDLHRLLKRASRIQLLDLDGESLERGVAGQQLTCCRRVEILAGIDVTGAAAALPERRSAVDSLRNATDHVAAVTDADIDGYRQRLGAVPFWQNVAGCNVIVSGCLLSQLISPLIDVLGAGHPGLLGLVQLVRDQHLNVLTRHLGRQGRALIASDFVSSDTCPAVLDLPNDAIESLATAALQDRNFFTGTNPLVVLQRLSALAGPAVANVRLLKPWRWRMTERRAFLVYALTFRTV
jgi:hypothetical protein